MTTMEPLLPSRPAPRRLPPPEENPWRNLSYAATTLQLMATLLDLFVESGDVPAMHYTITTLQVAPAAYLAAYQAAEEGDASWCRKPFLLLMLALLLQLYVLAIGGMWYDISLDVNSHNMEWSVFAVVLFYSLINPATYSSVADFLASPEEASKKKARMGPGAAAFSVFTKHFVQEKALFVLGALMACGGAILTTYQGAVINELTRMVTRQKIDPETGDLIIAASLRDVELKAITLVAVWAAANLSRFIFDILSSQMFSRLEVWLRGAVFEKAMAHKIGDADIADPAAEFGARYASDIQGVISLYGHLLRGVLVNTLLIITNFVFLALYDWEIAVATLCFLAMAVTSGPSELAGNATKSAQTRATEGLGMLSEGVRRTSDVDDEGESLCRKHSEEVLEPMRKDLFDSGFYTNSVDTYINFFSSFLTVIVVITMANKVFYGDMDSSDFLGVFFVFKQLQKPAMKMSGVLKSLIKKSANLERLNGTIFEAQAAPDTCDGGESGMNERVDITEGP